MHEPLITVELLAKLEQAAADLRAAREAFEEAGLIQPRHEREAPERRKHLRVVSPSSEPPGAA